MSPADGPRPASEATAAETDPRYQVPVLRGGTLSPGALTSPAVHVLGELMPVHVYVAPGAGDVLHVVFHGALNPGDRYPRMDRITTSLERGAPFLSFSDPGVGLAEGTEVERHHTRLGWFVGTRQHDLAARLSAVVDEARQALGCRAVVLAGSSGGGFAALHVSSRLPGSVAVVFNPQTDVTRYRGAPRMDDRAVTSYLSLAFPGASAAEALAEAGDRLSMVRRYRELHPDNHVHYVQDRQDEHHLHEHFAPFAEAVGLEADGGPSSDGRHVAVLTDGGRPGHHAPTRAAFALHLAAAIERWL